MKISHIQTKDYSFTLLAKNLDFKEFTEYLDDVK